MQKFKTKKSTSSLSFELDENSRLFARAELEAPIACLIRNAFVTVNDAGGLSHPRAKYYISIDNIEIKQHHHEVFVLLTQEAHQILR